MAYRAVVVDDEPIARSSLRSMLADVPWLTCVGEAGDGEAAITLLRKERPELLFLDVQMPGASGIDVLMRAGVETAVIFTTAHESYAMIAFEFGAMDYLRKPFGRARLMRALERTRVHLDATRGVAGTMGARDAGGPPDAATASAVAVASPTLRERLTVARDAEGPLERLYVRDRGAVVPVPVGVIVRCEADGDYVAVHAQGRRHLVYVNLSELAERLDATRFVRVHRSHVVNLDFVKRMAPHDPSRLALTMADGSTVVASRTGTTVLRARLG